MTTVLGYAVAALAVAFAIGVAASREIGYDLVAYLQAADRLVAGERLYPAAEGGPLHLGAGAFLYPPPIAALFVPLALLPVAVARAVWTALLVGVAAAVVWLHARRSAPSSRPWLIAGSAAFLPLVAELTIANVNLLSLALCLLAWELRHQPTRAGLSLALAVGLKLLPATVPLFFLVAGPRRVVVWAVGSAVVVTLLTLPWLGGHWLAYLALLERIAAAPSAQATTLIPDALQGAAGRVALLAIAAVLTVGAALAARRDPARAGSAFAVALAAAPLAAPGIWYPYLVFALPLLLRTVVDTATLPRSPAQLARAAAAGAGWLAMEFPKRPGAPDIAFAGLALLLVSATAALARRS